jgi:hypothetical protein
LPASRWTRDVRVAAPEPTAVSLESFSATPRDSAVDLSWTTASEIQNLGFHLHRSVAAGGPWERITTSLIPGLGSSPSGASYGYRDTGLSNGKTYFYLLEDVETTGRTKHHGPVSATPSAEAGGETQPSDEVRHRSSLMDGPKRRRSASSPADPGK